MKAVPAILALLLPVLSTRAKAQEPAFVHVARPGDTLASIAQLYYSEAEKADVLAAENGLSTRADAALLVGARVMLPSVRFHRVRAGDTWSGLATRYYGEPRRAFVLVEVNGAQASVQPEEGAELIVPYPLRYTATGPELLTRIAERCCGDESAVRTLRRFNALRSMRLSRGQTILVPLSDLRFSPSGQTLIQKSESGASTGSGRVRDLQAEVARLLPSLSRHLREGQYAETIADGSRLLGRGELTGNQVVTIQRALSEAYVAMEREDLACGALEAALLQQPDLELDAMRTSPKVLRAFRCAKERVKARMQH